MNRQNILFFTLLLLTCFLWGCSSGNPEQQEANTSIRTATEIDSGQLLTYGEVLGATDREVVNLLGEGEPGYVKGDASQKLSGRLYKKSVLGFSGETVVDYNSADPGTVEEVAITFTGATFGDVVDVISQQLGEVIMIERTAKNQAQAMWEYNDIIFDLTYYSGTLMLTIKNAD